MHSPLPTYARGPWHQPEHIGGEVRLCSGGIGVSPTFDSSLQPTSTARPEDGTERFGPGWDPGKNDGASRYPVNDTSPALTSSVCRDVRRWYGEAWARVGPGEK